MERSSFLQRISRILHWVGDLTSRSSTAVVVLLLLVTFGVVLASNGFPGSWEAQFSTVVSAITLLMLFVIQHTQGRHQKVLQLKLDELIRTSPEADDLLVHLEVARDDELLEREQEQVAHHEALRDDAGLEIVEFNPGRKS
ncbi:MAG: low affinity iron permease family protein [Acidimicrobiales bacterium]|jgi:low affinity Fe/Cu permease